VPEQHAEVRSCVVWRKDEAAVHCAVASRFVA
jgi:hypothetical protein